VELISSIGPQPTCGSGACTVDGSNNSVRADDATGLQYRVHCAAGTGDTRGSFTKIAEDESFDPPGPRRGTGLRCYKVAALTSDQEVVPRHITFNASSSESVRSNRGTHQ
jgi:hypothetical protein